jgi:formate/nitrite transporter FocA (FNT family)
VKRRLFLGKAAARAADAIEKRTKEFKKATRQASAYLWPSTVSGASLGISRMKEVLMQAAPL